MIELIDLVPVPDTNRFLIPGTGVWIELHRDTNHNPYYTLEGGAWINMIIKWRGTENKEVRRKFPSLQDAINEYNRINDDNRN